MGRTQRRVQIDFLDLGSPGNPYLGVEPSFFTPAEQRRFLLLWENPKQKETATLVFYRPCSCEALEQYGFYEVSKLYLVDELGKTAQFEVRGRPLGEKVPAIRRSMLPTSKTA